MDNKSSQPSQKRRAVLKGSLAAPVVLTVSSATAQMVTSHMKCMANVRQPTTTELPGIFFVTQQIKDSPADTWLREPIKVRLLSHDANTSAWFYNDPNAGWVNINTLTALPSNGGGWKLVEGTAEETRWALVWVDSRSGVKLGVSMQRPTDAQFTTESCNTSVRPTAQQ